MADVCGFLNPVTKRTGPFEVTVRVAFLYNESSIIPPHFHYGYEITQRMDKSGSSNFKNPSSNPSHYIFRRFERINEIGTTILEN